MVAPNGAIAIEELEKSEFDLLLTDLRMQRVDGMQVLERARELYPPIEVIVITTISSAVEAMRMGAYYYIPKPYKLDEVKVLVRQALEKHALRKDVSDLRRQLDNRVGPSLLIGNSAETQALKKMIEQIAPSDSSVLIFGETGTAREKSLWLKLSMA